MNHLTPTCPRLTVRGVAAVERAQRVADLEKAGYRIHAASDGTFYWTRTMPSGPLVTGATFGTQDGAIGSAERDAMWTFKFRGAGMNAGHRTAPFDGQPVRIRVRYTPRHLSAADAQQSDEPSEHHVAPLREACPHCIGGDGYLLGVLGSLAHYRCRACGGAFHITL